MFKLTTFRNLLLVFFVFLYLDKRLCTHLIKHLANSFPLECIQALLWCWNLSRLVSFPLFNIIFSSMFKKFSSTFWTFSVKAFFFFFFGYIWFNLWPTFYHVLNTIRLGLLIHIARASRWCGGQGKASSGISAGID